jgi:peroxiredoxin Q/BCP
MSASEVRVGDRAPDFTLPSQNGDEVTLSDLYAKRTVVLYFYPADETSGCTREACAFRDSYAVFADADAQVVGVSRDSVASHLRFVGRHDLPFLLLSDGRGEVHRRFGVRRRLFFVPDRVTFVIDRTGVVRHHFASLTRVSAHVDGALAVVRELAG